VARSWKSKGSFARCKFQVAGSIKISKECSKSKILKSVLRSWLSQKTKSKILNGVQMTHCAGFTKPTRVSKQVQMTKCNAFPLL